MKMKKQFQRTITVLPVREIAESTAWYELALGLETVYLHEGTQAGEATNYAVLIRDDLEIHLILDEMPDKLSWMAAGTGYLYLRVANVDEMFAEVTSRGVWASRGIEMMTWGVRNFQLTDPSGNLISVEEERYE
jgi:uncharacterized glyoxalase superfamily protein PhnB